MNAATAEIPAAALNSWYSVAGVAILTVGGWVSIVIRQKVNGKRLAAVGGQVADVQQQVGDVKNQVVNGHTTLLRSDLSEVLRQQQLVLYTLEQLPNQQDVRGVREELQRLCGDLQALNRRVDVIGRGLEEEYVARAALETRFPPAPQADGPES